MRDIDSARTSFEELKQAASLQDLKDAVRDNGSLHLTMAGCRSACWKAFLLFDTMDIASWQRTLTSSRSAYNSIRAHFLRPLENQDSAESGSDPLNDGEDAPSRMQLRKDEELRAEILQDVARCMPENLYFRQPDTQRMLLDILFVFCKLNPDVSYRQGMHELLAPMLWVVERDAIDPGQSSKVMGEDAAMAAIFDAAHVEHDAFAIFGQLMQSAKNFYEQTTTSGTENPIVKRSRVIFDQILPKVDERLAEHLKRIDVIPQIFLIRWIRLLFGREFVFDQTLAMWDVIFAEDPSLDIVNEICVAMLLKIRWQLLESDYNQALALLLHYPEIEADFSAQTFAVDAIYLRNHTDYHGGSSLISKYTGRPIYQIARSTTPPVLQRNQTVVSVTSSGNRGAKNTRAQASYASTSARDINKVIQSTAKELYARGEKLGIGKAVRNAVDEVQKRAQEIRDAPTPSSSAVHRPRATRSSLSMDSLLKKIQTLENRNRGLAKLLDGAIAELWEYQKTVSELDEQGSLRTSDIESLSAAIAKVQFVQVCLDDANLVLPAQITSDVNGVIPEPKDAIEEREEECTAYDNPLQPAPGNDNWDNPAPSSPSSHSAASMKAAESRFARRRADFEATKPSPTATQQIISLGSISKVTGDSSDTQLSVPEEPEPSRPRLEHSSFSWMLGQPDANNTAAPRMPSFASERPRKKGYLFGDDGE